MVISFSNPHILAAVAEDTAELVALLNSAYRGEESKKGWTTEEHLVAGDTRTNVEILANTIQQKNSVVLKYINEQQKIVGCVYLQQQGSRLYLGMLGVLPHLQGLGIGKFLLQAAEEYAQQLRCNVIHITVISLRTELITWYNRHGYNDTGERKPFVEDEGTGKQLQPLEFMVMEKRLDATI